MAGRRKLEHSLIVQEERMKTMQSQSPQTLNVVVDAVVSSFKAKAPLLEDTLILAFKANPKRIEEAVMESVRKVLSAPIRKKEFEWMKQYVLTSSIWLLPTAADNGTFMFEKLMKMAKYKAVKIEAGMDAIYDNLKAHKVPSI